MRIGLKFPLFSLSYWLRNWRFVIPFPCAVCDSRLIYRVYFEIGGLFGASALSAGLWNWINVREIPDVSAGIDFASLPDYEVWPIDRRWPFLASFMFEEIWDGVTLEGSLAVTKGKAPVLAIIVGAIVGVAAGEFRIINAGFHPWEMQLFPPGGWPEPWHLQFHAKVHYGTSRPVGSSSRSGQDRGGVRHSRERTVAVRGRATTARWCRLIMGVACSGFDQG